MSERHTFDDWQDKFDVYVDIEVDGVMTFWDFANYLSQAGHSFLTREGLRRYMKYLRG